MFRGIRNPRVQDTLTQSMSFTLSVYSEKDLTSCSGLKLTSEIMFWLWKSKMVFSDALKHHFYSIFLLGVKSAVYKPLNAEAEAEGRKTIGSHTEGLYRVKALAHCQALHSALSLWFLELKCH